MDRDAEREQTEACEEANRHVRQTQVRATIRAQRRRSSIRFEWRWGSSSLLPEQQTEERAFLMLSIMLTKLVASLQRTRVARRPAQHDPARSAEERWTTIRTGLMAMLLVLFWGPAGVASAG